MQLILKPADHRFDASSVQVPQLFGRGDLLREPKKPVDQIIEKAKPEQGSAPGVGRHTKHVLETGVYGLRRVHGYGYSAVLHVLDAYNVEKKTGLGERDVCYHSRLRKLFYF
jgi:hypothetical protein